MEERILTTVPVNQRHSYLRDTAERTEKFTYSRKLDEEELNELKTNFSNNAIEINRHDEVLKAAKEAHKESVKPLKQEMSIDIQKIRTRQEEVTEEVYLIADHDENKMGYYNSIGELVFERSLLQDERQLRIIGNEKLNGTY